MGSRGLAAVAVGAGLAVVLAGGCAAIPSTGIPVSTRTQPALSGVVRAAGLVPVMRPPQPGWDPQTVVQAFLLATAFGSNDRYTVARQYLTAGASKSWRPGTEITILAGHPSTPQGRPNVTAQGGNTALVTWQEIGTLTSAGQYLQAPGGKQNRADFSLQLKGGHYLINGLPAGSPQHPARQLFLTSYLFHHVYTSRNVYYYGQRNTALVPYPVFVPVWYTDPATELIKALESGPTGWLRRAATTAFPARAHLASFGVLPGPASSKIAVVGLTLPSRASATTLQSVASQLAATLTSPTYTSRPLFQAVRLKINGRLFYPPHSHDPLLRPGNVPHAVPHWPGNAPVYYLTPTGSPRMLTNQASRGVPLPGAPAGLSQIAVSPDGGHLAGIAGNTLYTSGLGASTGGHPPLVDLRPQFTGAALSSMSWDAQGDLWVAGQVKHSPGLWVLRSGHGPPVRVQLPVHLGQVTAVRVAPDGVRVAMIAGSGPSAQLVLGAIVHTGTRFAVPAVVPLGPGLTGVRSLTWYDEDYLLAVIQQAGKHGPQTSLWEVPANGDSASGPLYGHPGMLSITAYGQRPPLYLSLSGGQGGQVEKSVGLREQWSYLMAGKQAAYPG